MDYPCGKFGDCRFVVSAVLVLSCRQTHTRAQTQMNATPGVSKSRCYSFKFTAEKLTRRTGRGAWSAVTSLTDD